MKPDAVIVMPFILPWDRGADYQRQTCFTLTKSHKVVAYMQKDAVFFLKALWHRTRYPVVNKVRFYRPLYIFPFRRFRRIEQLNLIFSYIFFEYIYYRNRNIVLWLFDPVLHGLATVTRGISLYDCVDYHAGFHKGLFAGEIRKMERALIHKADYFFVNSNTLFRLHKTVRVPDAIVPQGFEIRSFHNMRPRQITLPVDKPIIGYVGTLDNRFDFKLIQMLAKRNPQWRFVIWGPDLCSGPVLPNPNILRGESSDRKTIASVIQQFSVGIIPYKPQNPGARYAFPSKVFEYFYLGKPVISTPIEELKRFGKFVTIAKTVQEWEQGIAELIKITWPKTYQNEQRRLAVANSWGRKVKKICASIDGPDRSENRQTQ